MNDRCDECRDDGFVRRAYEYVWTDDGLVMRPLPPANCEDCGKPLPAALTPPKPVLP